jgi:NAD-reducing hydrogenase small subunit
MAKPTIASDWMAGCSGCHMSLLDIDERLAQIAEVADVRATPFTDLKQPDDAGVDVGILEGAINNTSNEEVAHRMRARCKVLVALGDCAVFGGVPALRNFVPLEAALQRAYVETESNESGSQVPADPELCAPTPVRALQEVVKVDVFVPGCPPDPDVIHHVLSELAAGRVPQIEGVRLHWH